MSASNSDRESRIRGYSAETAMCVDLPLSAIQEQIETELMSHDADKAAALARLLETVKMHRGIVAKFTRPRAA